MPAPSPPISRIQRLTLVFNIVLAGLLLLEHQTLLPNTKSSIEKQITRLMDESAFVTSDTVETLQNDINTLMEDARNSMMTTTTTTTTDHTHDDEKEKKTTSLLSSNRFKTYAMACPKTDLPPGAAEPSSSSSFLYPPSQNDDSDKDNQELLKWFHQLCNGTYIELGSQNGVLRSSHSNIFHKLFHWKGLLVEPNPENFAQLQQQQQQNRPIINTPVCDTSRGGKHHLHWVNGKKPGMGGFLEYASSRHREVWFTPDAIANAQIMECQSLQTIIENSAVSTSSPHQRSSSNNDNESYYYFYDFLSLNNVVGGEYAILKSLNFYKVGFGMIVIPQEEEEGADNNNDDQQQQPQQQQQQQHGGGNNPRKYLAIRNLLERNGYTYLHSYKNNHYFYNNYWSEIYNDLIYTETGGA